MTAGDWPRITLEEIASVTAGNPAPQGQEYFEGGSRPFVRVQDLGRIGSAVHLGDTADLVNDRAAASLKLFPKGSVLFTKSGASLLLNQRAILGKDMHVVSHIGVAIPGPHVTSEWLYYWLRTVDFAEIAHGANMPSLQLSRVKQTRVPLPPIEVQRIRIAEIEKQFSRLDEAVVNLKRVRANLKRYKAALLKSAVEGRLVENGHSQDWAWAPLATVTEVQLGQQRAPVHAAAVEQIPYIRAANVTWAGLDLADVKTMGFPNAERYRLQVDDVLLAEASGSAAEVGKPAIWNGEIAGACYQKTLIRIRITAGHLIARFIYYFFLHACLSGQFARLAPGVGILHLTAERMLAWPICVPPLAEQRRIVTELDRCLSIVRELEVEVNVNLARAQTLRRMVLTSAFGNSAHE